MTQASAAAAAEAPTAFIEKQRGAMRIAALTPAALALGLTPGMALADANAQLPGLATVAHEPAADARWLARIADACDRYTPAVAIDPPDAVVLDITGCTHLFADEAGLIADIERRLAGVRLCAATAAGPEAALALARFRPRPVTDEAAAVRELPLAALRLDEASETALRRAGLVTIADLADRPTGPVAARFGRTRSPRSIGCWAAPTAGSRRAGHPPR